MCLLAGELFTVFLTLILSLLVGVEIGLLSGVCLDIAFVLQRTARPVLSFDHCESSSGIEYILMKPRHSLLCFPAAEYMRNGINSAIKESEKCPSFIVIDLRSVQELDYTAAKGIGGLKKELSAKNITLIILGCNEDIKLVLKACLKAQNVLQVENDFELNNLMQDQRVNDKMELKDVITPLLIQKDDDDISVIKKESPGRE